MNFRRKWQFSFVTLHDLYFIHVASSFPISSPPPDSPTMSCIALSTETNYPAYQSAIGAPVDGEIDRVTSRNEVEPLPFLKLVKAGAGARNELLNKPVISKKHANGTLRVD